MVSPLALAALLSLAPEPPPKPPKPSPEQRLAHVDHARIELHLGGRAYGRFLDAPAAYGGAVQLGLGVRLVRGLYLSGEATVGSHALPITASGQLFLGLRHELRMSKWVRPSFALGYSHLLDLRYSGAFDVQCGCLRPQHELGFGVSASSDIDIDQRHGLEAGFALRFPFRWAPRLSAYLRADAAYYFDHLPQRLQVSGGFGLQIVF